MEHWYFCGGYNRWVILLREGLELHVVDEAWGSAQGGNEKTEHFLAKYLSMQHNKDAVLWKQSIRLYQSAPALRSQTMVT